VGDKIGMSSSCVYVIMPCDFCVAAEAKAAADRFLREYPMMGKVTGLTCRGDNLYIAAGGFVSVLNANSGKTVAEWKLPDNEPGAIFGVCAHDDNQFFCSDNIRDKIILLNGDGKHVRTFGEVSSPLSTGSVPPQPGSLNVPSDLATLRGPRDETYVVVADSGNQVIKMFRGNECAFERAFGSKGTEPGQFSRPVAVALYADHVYVVDKQNNHIQVFALDGRFERVLQLASSDGMGVTQLCQPMGIAISNIHKVLYVADSGSHRVLAFALQAAKSDTIGLSHAFIASYGAHGSSHGQLDCPCGLALSPDQCVLYVVDFGNNQVCSIDVTPEGLKRGA
jgi:DNA-binding beta-propeller fold protein YncE